MFADAAVADCPRTGLVDTLRDVPAGATIVALVVVDARPPWREQAPRVVRALLVVPSWHLIAIMPAGGAEAPGAAIGAPLICETVVVERAPPPFSATVTLLVGRAARVGLVETTAVLTPPGGVDMVAEAEPVATPPCREHAPRIVLAALVEPSLQVKALAIVGMLKAAKAPAKIKSLRMIFSP